MLVDSVSRLQGSYGTRNGSAEAILDRAFKRDNGTEYTSRAFVNYCKDLGIRRELTAPYAPQAKRICGERNI